jgi:NAD(P)-dependent dehydrogenase (short-subunit alcohol dehydrogenase family)
MDLSGKVAIVTGSGRGLGLAYGEAPATAGAEPETYGIPAPKAPEG